jgi:hypothetical protein
MTLKISAVRWMSFCAVMMIIAVPADSVTLALGVVVTAVEQTRDSTEQPRTAPDDICILRITRGMT